MSKTRNCRYTEGEKALHNEAVRVRKMTDQQLTDHMRHIRDEAYASGYQDAERSSSAADTGTGTVTQLIEELSAGACKGIKSASAFKIEQFARERGYIA